MSFPIIEGTRFEKFRLNELLDYNAYCVIEFFEDCRTAKDVADKVIRVVQYPFFMGRPDDKHTWNYFHGKWCRTITDDYWQKASETALTMIGDCEDSSVLAASGMRLKGVSPENVYVAFGVVKDTTTGTILGGHSWVLARDASFGTDKFVLVESTLDTPPPRYPEVGLTLDDLKRPFVWEGIVYVPEQLFNDVVYVEVKPLTTMRERRMRERKEKYDAIMRAWKAKTKYHVALERSRLHRMKRALRLAR
jgi:hypothetical protein